HWEKSLRINIYNRSAMLLLSLPCRSSLPERSFSSSPTRPLHLTGASLPPGKMPCHRSKANCFFRSFSPLGSCHFPLLLYQATAWLVERTWMPRWLEFYRCLPFL